MNKYPASSNQLTELPPSVIPVPPLAGGIQFYSKVGSVNGHSIGASDVQERTRLSPFAWPFLALIYIYRYTVGHWFAGNCRFYPSCSNYGEEAFRKHGAWRGSIMTIKRLSRCHPWHDGGYDPVE